MIAVMDSETRGLFGKIFRIGYYNGKTYQTFNTGKSFFESVLKESEENQLDIFCFNLDFDLSKIISEMSKAKNKKFKIDYNKSLIISNKFHTAKIVDYPIYFRDIYPLVNSSLDRACKDFDLTTKKMDLEVENKEDYFLTVKANDKKLNEYLKCDVMATYELVYKLMELSKLPEEEFLKCPTVASLAMKTFKTFHKEEFELIKNSQLNFFMEGFVRNAYIGGRVEIFKNRLDKQGYHYDVNSLYPYVMEKYKYPVGVPYMTRHDLSMEDKLDYFNKVRAFKKTTHYIIHARIEVPKNITIGPLPYKDNGLIFPVGTFTGYFCSPELEFAIKKMKVKIIDVYTVMVWFKEADLFSKFIGTQKEIKLNSKGARRSFSKLIQNSLYGKFGMKRVRVCYGNYETEKYQKLQDNKKLVALLSGKNNEVIMSYQKTFFADYIRPQFSAFITSYARLELLKQMIIVGKNSLYYCDTDSIITDKEFTENTDQKEYGKWKLEEKLNRALFILPKLYAEKTEKGDEILKSKGIIKPYMQTLNYESYEDFYNHMIKRENITLYGYKEDEPKYFERRNILLAIKFKKDLDDKLLLKKQFCFENINYKREYDYKKNTSKPIFIEENILDEDEKE